MAPLVHEAMVSNKPLLPHLATFPPTHAAWLGVQADCSVKPAKMALYFRAV